MSKIKRGFNTKKIQDQAGWVKRETIRREDLNPDPPKGIWLWSRGLVGPNGCMLTPFRVHKTLNPNTFPQKKHINIKYKQKLVNIK